MTKYAGAAASGAAISGALRENSRVQAARLAFGMSGALHEVADWKALLAVSVRERCAALAWLRCGREIAANAPPEIAAGFRSHFAANSVRVRSALVASHEAANALEPMGVYPIVLKGPPLSARLYGDSAARVSSDLDWFVPAPLQATVYDGMVRAGWMPIEGERGGEVCYGRPGGKAQIYIEVHSSLLHPRYSYLHLPAPRGSPAVIEGVHLLAQDGPLVAGYLSAHLAAHRFAPLAWFVDIIELWNSLGSDERNDARQAASRAGLNRYLTWALGRAVLLRQAAEGDRSSARRLGLRNGWRVEPHPMWRHITLAPGVGGMARAAWTWVAPPWVGGSHANAIRMTVSRVAEHWRDALPARDG